MLAVAQQTQSMYFLTLAVVLLLLVPAAIWTSVKKRRTQQKDSVQR